MNMVTNMFVSLPGTFSMKNWKPFARTFIQASMDRLSLNIWSSRVMMNCFSRIRAVFSDRETKGLSEF